MTEYMVRWKRTAKNQWYYLPTVYSSQEEAVAMAERSNATLYRIEVVELNPCKVWGRNDSIPEQTVE